MSWWENILSRNNPILLDDAIKNGHQPAMMLRRVLDWTFTFCNQEDSKGVLLKRSSHVNTSRTGLHAVASLLLVILAGWQLNTCQLWFIDEKTWLSRSSIWPRLAKTREWPSIFVWWLSVRLSPDLWKFVCCRIISVKAAVKVTLNTCHYSLVTSLSNGSPLMFSRSELRAPMVSWWLSGGCATAGRALTGGAQNPWRLPCLPSPAPAPSPPYYTSVSAATVCNVLPLV